jgi:hypothetical protein
VDISENVHDKELAAAVGQRAEKRRSLGYEDDE